MTSIRLFIPEKMSDAYIYAGHIFAVFGDGIVKVLPLEKMLHALAKKYPRYAAIMRPAFTRNDWLTNQQTGSYFQSIDILDTIKLLWQNLASQTIILDNLSDAWQPFWEIPAYPVYDMRVFARRVYLGHRDGVHEGLIHLERDTVTPQNGLMKIFDARTIDISANSGELLFSANSAGLFHGNLWEKQGERTTVSDKQIAAKSLRTEWRGFNVVNYEYSDSFTYLANTTEKVADAKTITRYSSADEAIKKERITTMAAEQYSLAELKTPIDPDDVLYSFGDSNKSYFLLENRQLRAVNWASKEIRLSRQSNEIPNNNLFDDVPCSMLPFAGGFIIEFFDTVVYLRDGQVTTLESEPVISVRIFPTSRRFRQLVCITREDGIALHSFFPTAAQISYPKGLADKQPSSELDTAFA